jgi:hypothetical protein
MGSSSDDKSLPPLAERRPKPRKRVLLTGIVAYGEGAFSFDCTIRNLSETGARIALGTSMQLPVEFYLINVRDRIAYDARAAWNKGGEVGVIFEKALPLADIADPKLAFLKRLWMAKAAR